VDLWLVYHTLQNGGEVATPFTFAIYRLPGCGGSGDFEAGL